MKRKHSADKYKDITPEEIFLDSENLPGLDTSQFQGRLERPLMRLTPHIVFGVFVLLMILFAGRLWFLQIARGEAYLEQSESNRLDQVLLFAKRGAIVDRNGEELATNKAAQTQTEFPERHYASFTGLGHTLGYINYPQKDSAGFYFQDTSVGKDGVELFYNEVLAGENGKRLRETDALGSVLSESNTFSPDDGDTLELTIDARVTEQFYTLLGELAEEVGFRGGAGVFLDVHTGEILTLASYPSYDPTVLTEGEEDNLIAQYVNDERKPFLNRAIGGLYAPGSIIKPFVALGALEEGVIDPGKELYSSGELVVPNPYDPDAPSIFKDWKAHGLVDLRRALAVSSNVYFFEVGGGFEDQRGIGIAGIEKYARAFGIGSATGVDLPGEVDGVIPNPAWKASVFPNDPWRLGDTYNTSIGQYGLQVTPLQMARAVAAIANGGVLVAPHVRRGERAAHVGKADISEENLQIVREGMRDSVLEGTATGLATPDVRVAAKTGTAELGSTKQSVNSWVIGFFPYEKPRFAFAVVMEHGPARNLIGSLFVVRQLLDWMSINTPEYLE